MLIHPEFNPIALQLGPLAVRWYGLMYLIAFLSANLLGRWRARLPHYAQQGWAAQDMDDLVLYCALGTILGGRFGYVLFYQFGFYLEHPLSILKVWEGGMSFHGGLLGVTLASYLFAKHRARSWFSVTDYIAVLVPAGLLAGRLGNFINGELWGRVTHPELPWAMLFPQAAYDDMLWINQHASEAMLKGLDTFFGIWHGLPRHPSQLYELVLEGCVLGIGLWWFARKARPAGAASALFLMGYGAARFIIEFFREPDSFLGPLTVGFSRGQWLSLPMMLIGVFLWIRAYRRDIQSDRTIEK